jgi:hypothetical protein
LSTLPPKIQIPEKATYLEVNKKLHFRKKPMKNYENLENKQ